MEVLEIQVPISEYKSRNGVYLYSIDLKKLLQSCKNEEEQSCIIVAILSALTDKSKELDDEKFPKKGVLFYIPHLKRESERYLQFLLIVC